MRKENTDDEELEQINSDFVIQTFLNRMTSEQRTKHDRKVKDVDTSWGGGDGGEGPLMGRRWRGELGEGTGYVIQAKTKIGKLVFI